VGKPGWPLQRPVTRRWSAEESIPTLERGNEKEIMWIFCLTIFAATIRE
jgi:hypothetical protein